MDIEFTVLRFDQDPLDHQFVWMFEVDAVRWTTTDFDKIE